MDDLKPSCAAQQPYMCRQIRGNLVTCDHCLRRALSQEWFGESDVQQAFPRGWFRCAGFVRAPQIRSSCHSKGQGRRDR